MATQKFKAEGKAKTKKPGKKRSVAQVAERAPGKGEAGGSTPPGPTNVGGRPSKLKAEVVEQICQLLAGGKPLAAILRDGIEGIAKEDLPTAMTVRNWMKEQPEVFCVIARAREDGEEVIAAECLDIADDARNDWMLKINSEGEGVGYQFNSEHVQRSKLRIDTRLKLLAKWNPKKWGDKVEVEHSGTVNIKDKLRERMERARAGRG